MSKLRRSWSTARLKIVSTQIGVSSSDPFSLFTGIVQDRELEQIHDRYMNCLKTFIEYNFPQEPNRVQELLVKLPEVKLGFLST